MRALRKLLDANEQTATAWWHMQMRLATLRGRAAVIVYQMGKVGSSTIVASLHAHAAKLQVHHVHTLTPQGLDAAEAVYRRISQTTGQSTRARARHLQSSRYLMPQLHHAGQEGEGTGKRWKVITLVREPVARNVSSFFQTIDYYLPNFMAREAAGEVDQAQVSAAFLEKFDQDEVLNWFDRELFRALHIDVYATPFPHEQGYAIYHGACCDLLLLKLETLDHYAADAIRAFLDLDDFSLVQRNVATQKEYGAAYERFKRRLTLPAWYIEEMYASQYARHFYTAGEIARFRAKWVRADRSVTA